MKERVTFPKDFWEQGRFFFFAPSTFDESVSSKKWNDDVIKVLTSFNEEIKKRSSLDASTAKSLLEQVTSQLSIPTGKIMQAVRLAITGVGGGPDLMMIMEIIGKDEVSARIAYALKTLKVKTT